MRWVGKIHSLPWRATRRRGRNFGGPRAVVAAMLEGHAPSWPGTTMDHPLALRRTRRRAPLHFDLMLLRILESSLLS